MFDSLDTLFWTTGAVVWLLLITALLWLSVEMVRALALSASWLHFTWTAAQLRGSPHRPTIRQLPRLVLTSWTQFLWVRRRDLARREANGEWRGFGDWSAYPLAPMAQLTLTATSDLQASRNED